MFMLLKQELVPFKLIFLLIPPFEVTVRAGHLKLLSDLFSLVQNASVESDFHFTAELWPSTLLFVTQQREKARAQISQSDSFSQCLMCAQWFEFYARIVYFSTKTHTFRIVFNIQGNPSYFTMLKFRHLKWVARYIKDRTYGNQRNVNSNLCKWLRGQSRQIKQQQIKRKQDFI